MRLIDADELTAEIQSMSLTISGEDVFPQSAKDSVLVHIVTQPSIDAVPVVHGRVVENGNPICGPCSNCGESVNRKWSFCPSCGAKMDAPDGGVV